MCHLVSNLVPISFCGFCIRWGVSYWESQSRSGTLGGTDWISQRIFSGDSHAFILDCWVLLSLCVRAEAPERPVILSSSPGRTFKERIPETTLAYFFKQFGAVSGVPLFCEYLQGPWTEKYNLQISTYFWTDGLFLHHETSLWDHPGQENGCIFSDFGVFPSIILWVTVTHGIWLEGAWFCDVNHRYMCVFY